MIDRVSALIGRYSDWLRAEMSPRELDSGWIELTTPFLDRNNDAIQIFLQLHNDTITLTDDALTIQELRSSGCDLTSPAVRSLLASIVNGFDVQLRGDSLSVQATPENYAVKQNDLLQAILAVSDLYYTAVANRAASTRLLKVESAEAPRNVTLNREQVFRFEVTKWLSNIGATLQPEHVLLGQSGKVRRFDFVLPRSRVPMRIIEALMTLTPTSLGNVAISINDVRRATSEQIWAYAFLNDEKRSPPEDLVDTLSKFEIRPVPWSRRQDVQDELAA